MIFSQLGFDWKKVVEDYKILSWKILSSLN